MKQIPLRGMTDRKATATTKEEKQRQRLPGLAFVVPSSLRDMGHPFSCDGRRQQIPCGNDNSKNKAKNLKPS
jgi:hypothetical protein